MNLNIQDFTISLVADKMMVNVISITDNSATIFYQLIRSSDNYICEQGNKVVPIQVLGIFAQQPMNYTAVNQVLSNWGITAIEPTPDPIDDELTDVPVAD